MVYVSCKTIIMVACHFIWIVTLTRRGWYKPVWRTRKLMKTKTAPRLFQVFFILIMSWGCVVSRIILNSSLSLIQINIFSLFPLRFLWNISIHCYSNFFFSQNIKLIQHLSFSLSVSSLSFWILFALKFNLLQT